MIKRQTCTAQEASDATKMIIKAGGMSYGDALQSAISTAKIFRSSKVKLALD